MELSRVTVTVKEHERQNINDVAGLLGAFDFIVTMIDRTEGQIMGFVPTVSVEALESIQAVDLVEITSTVGV